jgi:hypothetical protein
MNGSKRKWSGGVGGFVIALVLVLWLSGRLDIVLAPIGLNKNECVTNAFGATFCGDDAKRYEQQVSNIQSDLNQIDEDNFQACLDASTATTPEELLQDCPAPQSGLGTGP